MALIDDVYAAHGGLDRWRRLDRFTVQFSMNGGQLEQRGRPGALKEVAAQGCTRKPWLRIAGFPAADKCVVYRPERMAIETLVGASLARLENPLAAIHNVADDGRWDDFQVGYFCSVLLWNCLVSPFLLSEPGVELEEVGPWTERQETWRCLRAIFPGELGAIAQEQSFYFDGNGLQQRVDYSAGDSGVTRLAKYSSAHQVFSGIMVPTLHRSLILETDGTVVRRRSHVDIEIFDAQFE